MSLSKSNFYFITFNNKSKQNYKKKEKKIFYNQKL